MHESILLLERLYALDAERDRQVRRFRELERTVAGTDQEAKETAQQADALQAEIAGMLSQEALRQAELDKLVGRRDRTAAQVDQGLIADVQTAMRQLEAQGARIDELELELLEGIEAREAVERRLTAARQRGERLALRRAREAEQLAQEGGAIRARVAALAQERPARLEGLPAHLLHDYEAQRRTTADALSHLVDGACAACHVAHPPQVVIEVQAGKRLHRCRGCERFLVAPTEAAASG